VTVEFNCHHCGRELKADERAIGRKVRCPECETLLVIPQPGAEEESEQGTGGRGQETDGPEGPSHAQQQPESEMSPPKKRQKRHQTKAKLNVGPPKEQPAGDGGQESGFKGHRVRADVTPPPIAVSELRDVVKARGRKQPTAASDPPLLLPAQKPPEDLIDMTAMVDIVFFLLIFFMVTSLQALEAVMNMPTPQSAEGGAVSSRSVSDLENDPNYITVRIEDDDSIWVEDTQVFNDQELALRLRSLRRESDGPRSLLVIGDADASHGSAVRVFDAGAGAGVNGISLIVQEKDSGQ
jgi:biopolymer transport protein ExbD